MNLNDLAVACHETAKEKGFWDREPDIDFILSKLALIHSEASETLEALRKEKGDQEVFEECADILIRLLDFVEGLKSTGWVDKSMSFEDVVRYKMNKNSSRPRKHGNLA